MELVTGKIVSATLEEEVRFNENEPPMNKFVVDVESNEGKRTNDLVMWLPKGGKANPPTEGESGTFELEPKNGYVKLKRHRAGGGSWGGGRSGGGSGPRPTSPEDAKRISRASGLSSAVALAAVHPDLFASSDAVIAVAGKFAAFIYGENV